MKAQEIIEQTKQLITIRSTADRPEELRKAVEFVANKVSSAPGNITIERFERNGKPSFLAYRKGKRPEKFDILLNGHVDVVPGKPEQFKPYEKDGKLYGRGALDMKGTTLALTDVFCEMVNDVPYSLGLQIVSDEEIGGYDGVRMHIDDFGVRANFVIMGEYSNHPRTIYNAARGLCWTEILFKGKSAHGGHLWHGSNAVVKAGAFAGAVLKRYPTPDKETWTTTASISDLSTSNDAYNKVPDNAVLKIDFRFTQEDPVFQSRESLVEFIHELDPEAELVNTATFEPAVHVESLNPYVQGMSLALENVTGQKPNFLGRPAGSDGRHFALVKNDIVEYGLYGQGSHSADEYVELSSFAEYQATLRGFLRKPIPDQLEQAEESEPLREQLLRTLIEIPSVSEDFGGNNKVLEFVEKFLRDRSMHVERIDNNGFRSIIATTRPDVKRPTVLLNAHSDTVPAADEMFKLTLKDGKFYGRGVMDMKHAIAAYLAAVDSMKDELGSYDFGLMITSDEEIGSNNGAKPLVEMGYGGKVVIVPDGGNDWKLETFAKGVKWVKLETTGKAAHASRPWEGESAIRPLLNAIRDIEQLMPKNPTPQDTIMSVGTINGGTAANQIPTRASAMLDIRPGSVADHERLTPLIEKICKQHGVSVEFQANEPPCVTDPEDPLVKPFVEIVEQVTGEKHATSYDFAVTDGRIFSAAGMSTIVINPECGNIHREDEWLSQESFGQFCQVVESYVRRMAHRDYDAKDGNKQEELSRLARSLNKDNEPVYVWYASYGSGLSRETFRMLVQGGLPSGTAVPFAGCRDKTAPQKDVLASLPYKLYFSGKSERWGGGFARIEPDETPDAHTIARLHLVTLDQFDDIYEQLNGRGKLPRTALKTAMRDGKAIMGDGANDYDALIFCGMREGHPVLTLTAPTIRTPYTHASQAFTKAMYIGLNEGAAHINTEVSLKKLLTVPGLRHSPASKELRDAISDAQLTSEYLWYATFGSGLSEKHFLMTISGEKPNETVRHNVGCTDKSLPLENTFISLPYKLFFAGDCQVHGGGHAFIDYRRDETIHTISRAYLIKRSQFEEIVAQENLRHAVKKLPYKESIKHGHATIGHGGDYDELLYCGMKDGYPVFSVTTPDPGQPYTTPSGSYIDMVCQGLSEASDLERPKIAHYLMATPGLNNIRSREQIRTSIEHTK